MDVLWICSKNVMSIYFDVYKIRLYIMNWYCVKETKRSECALLNYYFRGQSFEPPPAHLSALSCLSNCLWDLCIGMATASMDILIYGRNFYIRLGLMRPKALSVYIVLQINLLNVSFSGTLELSQHSTDQNAKFSKMLHCDCSDV